MMVLIPKLIASSKGEGAPWLRKNWILTDRYDNSQRDPPILD